MWTFFRSNTQIFSDLMLSNDVTKVKKVFVGDTGSSDCQWNHPVLLFIPDSLQ